MRKEKKIFITIYFSLQDFYFVRLTFKFEWKFFKINLSNETMQFLFDCGINFKRLQLSESLKSEPVSRPGNTTFRGRKREIECAERERVDDS